MERRDGRLERQPGDRQRDARQQQRIGGDVAVDRLRDAGEVR
jgi:hypothetical protein